MADLDPQTIAELNDNIALMNSTMRSLTGTLGDLTRTLGGTTTSAKQNTAANRDAAAAAAAAAEANEDQAASAAKADKAMQDLTVAYHRATGIVGSFASALLNGEKSFAKYNNALGSAGDAAWEFGKSLGPLGAILGGIVKAGTMVAQAYTKQADDLLKASDDISKLGAANSFSAEQIRQMGRRAGLASDQLDKMVKPMQSMSGGLTLLGATSADGVKKFGEMIAVSKETRMAFQRLGLSDGELIQAQADYVGMLERTGGTLVGNQKTQAALQKQSLEYTQNLYELSAITGKSIEESKKDMEIARSSMQWKLQENKWAREYQEAEKNRDTDKMKRIMAEKEAANKLINDVAKLGDPAKTAAVQMQYLTGAVTKESAQFAMLGINVDKQIKAAKDGSYVQGQFNDAYKKGAQRYVESAGASLALSEGLQKATGLNEKTLDYLNKRVDVEDEVAASAEARAKLEANKAGEGAAAQDQAQIARNALTEAERSAKLALDDLIASTNPLLKNFDDLDPKMKAFIVAIAAATAALGVAGLVKGVGALKDVLGGAGKAAASGAAKGGLLKTGARVLGKAALPVAGAMAAYDAYKGFTADKDATLGQKLKNAGSSALSGVTFGLLGSSPEEIAARKAAGTAVAKPKETKEELEKQKRDIERRKIAEEAVARDQSLSKEERQLAQSKLRAIALEKAYLENKMATLEFQNATTPEEKAAALAKSDRARKTIQQTKYAESLEKLESATSEAEAKAAQEGLLKARKELANIEIWRATQQLKTASTEEQKKEAQARIDAAKKGLEQAQSDIKAIAEKKAEDVKSAAAPAAGTAPTTPAPAAGTTTTEKRTEGILIANQPVTKEVPLTKEQRSAIQIAMDMDPAYKDKLPQWIMEKFAGGFADGGLIPKGKFGLVGERGPELISGPSQITSIEKLLKEQMEQKTIGGVPYEEFSRFSEASVESEKSLGKFDKELKDFVREDPVGKMSKQLKTVNEALTELNELIDPNASVGGANVSTGSAPAVPSAGAIASAVIKQISGSIPSGGGGGGGGSVPSGAMPAVPSDKKRRGIFSALASALGVDTGTSSTGGKDGGDASPTGGMTSDTPPTGGARPAVPGSMSEDDIKKMIIAHEGIRTKPYKDSLGLWTVGIGHLIGDGKTLPPAWNREFSMDEVMALFEKDYEKHKKQAQSNVPGFSKYDSVGQGALIDLTFNMGPGWPRKFPNTSKKLAAGDTDGAARGLEDSLWYQQVKSRGPRIVSMIENAKVSARDGGLAMGPETGYPATLHGNEMIVPLDANSILAEMGKKTKLEIENEMKAAKPTMDINPTADAMKEITNMNKSLMEMISNKLDNMIGKLEVSNETQTKILRVNQV